MGAKDNMKIVIGGDLVPTESNFAYFSKSDVNTLIGLELANRLLNADFTIFNLEVPITDWKSPIAKCGPNLAAPAATIKGLRAINPHFFTLANNHILDQGEQGLRSTIELLRCSDISYAGAGEDIYKAATPFIYEKDGTKVGIYCCAEREFSIATATTAGANPFDPLESLDHISALRRQVDYVIVLYHGGKEHYRYPSPILQKTCRKIVEKGADIIICQHSHCIGCKENWKNGTIIYGQGNFLFDHSDSDYWQTSLLIELDISAKGVSIKYIPLEKHHYAVRQATEKKETILNAFLLRSEQIQQPGFVDSQYGVFAQDMLIHYETAFLGKKGRSLIFRIINKLFGGTHAKRFYQNRDLLVMQNYVECEAHRELIIAGCKRIDGLLKSD